jgi:hypothetical protein
MLLLLACGGTRPHGASAGSEAVAVAADPRMQARWEQVCRAVGPAISGRAERALAEGGEERLHAILDAGRRYLVLAVGAEGTVLRLSVEDEHGRALAAVEGLASGGLSVPLAPRWTGPFLVRVRALRGGGLCGVQIFLAP